MGHRAGDISLHPPGHQREEDDGNGSGVEVRTKLNGKQVSLILGAVLGVSTTGAWLTSRPSRAAEAAVTVEAVEKALEASPKYQLAMRRIEELGEVVGTMAGQVKVIYDAELVRQGREQERQRQRRRDEGGGSKQ